MRYVRHFLCVLWVGALFIVPSAGTSSPVDGERSAAPGWGRSVTIAITGVDSRLGVEQAHADANHILRIWLDQGRIDIISVPRGTPADAGFSSSSLNIIANYRAQKARAAYLRKLAQMTGVGRIDYYIEIGFSQAIGIFELLGFKGTATTMLHVLRTRKAFDIGDHQRCYNQAQFIRQMILKHFPRSDRLLDALALRSALALAETNLRYDVVQGLITTLRAKGFPRSDRDIRILLRPHRFRTKEFDFRDPEKVELLSQRFDRILKQRNALPAKPTFRIQTYQERLHRMMVSAARALDAGQPARATSILERPYQQRAWLQLPDERVRNQYMELICHALIEAYESTGNILKADGVRSFMAQLGTPSTLMIGTSGIVPLSTPTQ